VIRYRSLRAPNSVGRNLLALYAPPATMWPTALQNQPVYMIIDVHVKLEVHAERVDGPPGYESAVGKEELKASNPKSNEHPTGKGVHQSFLLPLALIA